MLGGGALEGLCLIVGSGLDLGANSFIKALFLEGDFCVCVSVCLCLCKMGCMLNSRKYSVLPLDIWDRQSILLESIPKDGVRILNLE